MREKPDATKTSEPATPTSKVEQPVQTDNRPRPEDGEQDVDPLEGNPVTGDADTAYDPDRDGIEDEA